MFSVEFGGQYDLSVEDVWPDGDAPENPTTADVLTAMRKSGSLSRLISDWNMEIEEIEVSGPGGTAYLTEMSMTSVRCTCGRGDGADRHHSRRCPEFIPPETPLQDSTTPNRDEARDDSRGQERAAGTGGTDAALPPTLTPEQESGDA